MWLEAMYCSLSLHINPKSPEVGFLLNPPSTLILCLSPSWFDCQRAQSRTEKMFLIVVSQAPPVGSYEIKTQRHGTAPGFGKGKRFAELKGWSGNKEAFLEWSNHQSTGFKLVNKMSSWLFYSTITPLIRQSMWKVPNWTENETIMNHLSKADCIIKIGIICILAIKLQLLVSP